MEPRQVAASQTVAAGRIMPLEQTLLLGSIIAHVAQAMRAALAAGRA
jgi:hypothetical protein